MESGEMVTKEEFQRRNKEREEMEGIDEDDEDEEEDNWGAVVQGGDTN